MSAYANYGTARESGLALETHAPGADENRSMAQRLGIGFDGRYYRYRDYRYDRLSDALNYARLEQARSGAQPPAAQPQWLEPLRPTEAERQLMGEFGVAFDGRCYVYDGYRYDHCKDAANYAKLKNSRKVGG